MIRSLTSLKAQVYTRAGIQNNTRFSCIENSIFDIKSSMHPKIPPRFDPIVCASVGKPLYLYFLARISVGRGRET
jgi:hypothetical protein